MSDRSLLRDVFPKGSVRRTTLPNGLRVIAREKKGSGVVAIVTYVGVGYFDETDDVSGIAHVLEHMYFKGTPTRGVGEIAKATKSSGGILNAATIYDHTHYYAVLPASGFEAGIEIQADAYANSLIDEGELARELEVIIEEAKRKADTPTAVATETLFEMLHDHHRIRRWRIGREAGLRTFTSEKVRTFYRNFYRPRNTVLAIVGDVDPKRALAAAEKHYGHLTDGEVARMPGPGEPPPKDSALRYRELNGDVQQSEVLLGWRTPDLKHPDTPILDLLAAILSGGRASRLYRAVRDRRLASSISAWNYTPTELGIFVVHATARPERATSALRASWDQVTRILEGEVREAEIERARRMLSAQWLRRLETSEGQANHLAAWELEGDWERGGEYLDALLSANELQVSGVANRWLQPTRAGILVYRPSNATPFAADAGSILAMLGGERPEPVEAVAMVAPTATVHSGTRAWRLEAREGDVSVYRTVGNVPLLIQRTPGPIAHLGWFVNGGAFAEDPELAGVTSLMCRAALRGTERRSAKQIAEDVEFAGGAIGSVAGHDSFQWGISVPVARLADAAEILGDVVQRPAFRSDAVESERAVALAEIASIRDDMYRWPLRLAVEGTWGTHPYGRQVLGTEGSVGKLGPQYLTAWHEAAALSARGVLVCVADADPDDVAATVARRFGDLIEAAAPSIPAPDWPSRSDLRVETRQKAQSALAMLLPGPARDDEDRFTASILCGIASGLGGRFFEELREKKSLAYTVMLMPLVRQLAGAFVAYIAMSPEKEDAARDGLLAEFARLAAEPVTPRELAQAQTYALGTHAIRRESASSIMGDLADTWLFGKSLAEIGEYEDRIRAVTAEKIQKLARLYFDPSQRIEGLIRGAGRKV
jgi:zinc protease